MVRAPRAKSSGESMAIPTRFTREELTRIERARAWLGSASRSAFIRQSVMGKVEEVETTGILQFRDVDEEEAARLMDAYLREHPGVHYVSEMIEELGLEPRVAFVAARRLIDGGRARTGRG